MTQRILFIDDQMDLWANAFQEELGQFDFEVLCEEDPSKALRLVSSYQPDAVLLDILFPKGALGKPTLEKIKKHHPNLPVIMITSTMDKAEYRPEDYALADYRYSKEALRGGDFSDLAAQLNRLIQEAGTREETPSDDTGMGTFGFIVGKTETMHQVAETAAQVASLDHTVLITGESGTGKELIARFIHERSGREKGKFVAVVCAALARELLESELFGHEKGAFTGAVSRKKGKFELAGNGTIFLDEIGDMPLETQVKLLRFLQERTFERVGGTEVLQSNARIIAASNQDLQGLIAKRAFREDLYFRLNVIEIKLPPLRERKEDLPLFFDHFVKRANRQSGKQVLAILRDDLKERLISYPWPGNIREFENAVERAVALSKENILQLSNFPGLDRSPADRPSASTDLSDYVDQVFRKEKAWDDLKGEFGAKGSLRKELILGIIDRWMDLYHRRPTSKALAELLSVSDTNMRRLIKESGLQLTNIKKP